MNLLVTGAAGFIGSSFVRTAQDNGDDIIMLDALTYAGRRSNIDGVSGTFIHGNICDKQLVTKLLTEHSIDAIVNFAAESHVDNSIDSSSIFIETNVNGVHNLLECARVYWQNLPAEKKQNFRFIQVSTDEVYGSLELGSAEKFTEESQYKPSSPYSASKAAGDHLALAWYKTYSLPIVITNCTNNYGARQFPEKLIPAMILRALSGEQLTIYGDGKNVRDWIYVEDHCAGVYLALTKGKLGEQYCFGGDAEKDNNYIVNAICEQLDVIKPRSDGASYKEQISYIKDRLGHDRRYAIDDSKAQKELGFTRSVDFEEGLRKTINWYLKDQSLIKECA